ncbi:MAG: hypothetical protein RR942_15150 [Romboutsia sp.]
MVDDSTSQGVNDIIGFKLTSSAVMQDAVEVLAYSTIVIIENSIRN